MAPVVGIAENDVAIHLVSVDLGTDIDVRSDLLANPDPIAFDPAVGVNHPLLAIRGIDESIHDASLAALQEDGVSRHIAFHFIYDIRIAVAEIELLKRALPRLDAEFHLIGIVEKEQSSEQGALSDTLRAGEVNVAIGHNLGVRDIGAIQENDLIQVFHNRSGD